MAETVEESLPRQDRFLGWPKRVIEVLLFLTALFYLYTAWAGQWGMTRQRGILMVVCLIAVFMNTNPTRKLGPRYSFLWDVFLSLLTIALYIPAFLYDYTTEARQITGATIYELIAGLIFILVLLEATRRALGIPFTVVCIVAILLCKWGNMIPGLFRTPGMDWFPMVDYLIYSGSGVYGIALYVAATVIVVFVIFGALLQKAGGSLVFDDLPRALFGTFRGGPAKVAVVGSSIMGMMSGSPAANVATTGAFTIPMMKRVGYSSQIAGAIETVASCGGQILPPIMGAAAFIMADILHVSYWDVAVAAFAPASLFYLAVFVQVDIHAGKFGLKGVPRSELPAVKQTVIGALPILFPILVLIYFLGVARITPQRAGLMAVITLIIASWFRRETRVNLKELYSGLALGMQMMVIVTVACAAAGIVIGAINLTGIGLTISSSLIALSHGNIFLLLILVAVASIIMGMGLTTTPCYILLAFLIGPALVEMGIEPMAAHLFILYYGVLSQMTPPSAIAAYTAAGIAGSNAFPTAFSAMRFAFVKYLIPFVFVFNNNIILMGSLVSIIVSLILAIFAVVGIAIAFEGYFWSRINTLERILMVVFALGLVGPWGLKYQLLSLGFLTIVIVREKFKKLG